MEHLQRIKKKNGQSELLTYGLILRTKLLSHPDEEGDSIHRWNECEVRRVELHLHTGRDWEGVNTDYRHIT